jgi:hypothetical protein
MKPMEEATSVPHQHGCGYGLAGAPSLNQDRAGDCEQHISEEKDSQAEAKNRVRKARLAGDLQTRKA